MSRVIVIGGGIAGLSAAANFSSDLEVTVLEAETSLGYHASGRSAALIEQNYGAPPVQALNRASFPILEAGGYLSPRGLMIVAKSSERTAFESDVSTMGLAEITPQDACAKVPVLDPKKVSFAAYHAEAYDIDTDKLLQDFARRLRSSGGQLQTNARAVDIDWDGSEWTVQTATNRYRAELLVNAAGAWADQIAQLAGLSQLGVVPYRRSMARIAAPGGAKIADWPMFFGVDESWYAKPDAGALLVSPADEVPTHPHDAWADDLTLAKGLALYEDMVTEPVTRMIANWAGLRSFAPDRSLVLGPDPRLSSFVWCAGQGGYGMQTSPAAGKLLADLTLGRPPALPANIVAALKPDRLI
ncbi:MAG: FAD-binding oxidoreductase [Pseudomonadota bacterium]